MINSIVKNTSLLVIMIYALVAVLAFFKIIGGDYSTTHMENILNAPSLEFFMGTDHLGRSTLSRIFYGTYVSLRVGLISALLAIFIGVNLGLISGYFQGWVDRIITAIYTTIDSVPYILLLSSFALVMGRGLFSLCVVFGLTCWTSTCRIVRSEVLKQKNLDYLLAAKSLGAGELRQLIFHILPNIKKLVLTQMGLVFVTALKSEVILSYLGLGVEIGTPSWGTIIDDAKLELLQGVWWNITFATLSLFFLLLSANLVIEEIKE